MDFDRLFAVKPAPIRFAKRIASVLLPALLLFVFLPTDASAQATIQGSVTTQDGQPLIGAQVQVMGTNQGAVTDADGRYSISGVATGRATVSAQYLGYRSSSRAVQLASGVNTIDFALAPAPVELDAIVVTGTAGRVQKRSLGNAVSQINAEDVLERAPVTNLAELVQGRAAGVVVMPSSGQTGGGSALRLRGISSITQGNEPLIYIDGVRVDNTADVINSSSTIFTGGQNPSRLNDLTPEDIESIEIIKGPAAATLYGSEAAAGVVQIITKKGLSGETRWNLKGAIGRRDLDDNNFPDNFARIAAGAPLPTCPENDITNRPNCGVRLIKTLDDGRQIIAQNPIDIMKDEGLYQDYTANVSGGRDNFTFFVSGNYQDNEGTFPNDEARKISGRGNFQWTQSEIFDISVSSGYTNNAYSLPQSDNNIFGFFGNAFLSSPANIRSNPVGAFVFGEPFTPMEVIGAIDTDFTNDRFTGSLTSNFNPFNWLQNRATFGIDVNAEENLSHIPFGAVANLSPFGEKTNHRMTRVNITFDYNGTASWDVTESLRSNTSVGTQIFNENRDRAEAFGRDFPAPGVSTVSAAGTTQGFESRVEETTVGIYVQEQIAWANRLFLTGAVRFDDSSAFGEDFDFETYPKVSASYVISEEPWFGFDLLNSLKLRGAYGFAGRQPGAFAALRVFSPTQIAEGEAAITPGDLGNRDLGPERSREIELGFDASLWDDRIGLEVTYYNKVTEDALLGRPNVPSEGFPGTTLVNLGEIENKGWEFGINAFVLDTDRVDWDVNLTMATNDNEITDLGGVEPFNFGFTQRIEEGHPVGAYFSRVIEGREADGSPIFSADPEFIGGTTPGFFGSLGNTITLFDNLQIYGLLEWKSDFYLHNFTDRFRFQFGNTLDRVDPDLQDPDTPQGRVFQDKLASFGAGSNALWIEEADFVKLRELSATLSLPSEWASRLFARRASLTFSGRNLKTWTDYSGVDPEVNVFGQAGLSRGDFLGMPQTRLFITTLNLTF